MKPGSSKGRNPLQTCDVMKLSALPRNRTAAPQTVSITFGGFAANFQNMYFAYIIDTKKPYRNIRTGYDKSLMRALKLALVVLQVTWACQRVEL